MIMTVVFLFIRPSSLIVYLICVFLWLVPFGVIKIDMGVRIDPLYESTSQTFTLGAS